MLRYALRRLLLMIPTLVGTSLVVFLVTTLVPDPVTATLEARTQLATTDPAAYDALQDERRQRFLDLPRFFNPQPNDVRVLATQYSQHIADNDELAMLSTYELNKLGGAALPWILPDLEKLPPTSRGRVAVALVPIAERMGLAEMRRLHDPQEAVLFWTRFWEDRELDFTQPSVHRTVTRLVQHPTDERELDLVQVDTYALPELIHAMRTTTDRVTLGRLMSIAAHARGSGASITPSSTNEAVERAIVDWEDWWYTHETDYVALGGAQKVAATFSETRYGKWLTRVASGDLGRSTDGRPVASMIRERSEITLTLALLALFVAYALAVPLGIFSAWRRGKNIDRLTLAIVVLLHAVPTFVAAAALAVFASGIAGKLTLGVIALACGSFATISRQQRASMLDALGQDYVRTARAKGVSSFRMLIVHALRNALVPTVALAGTQLPLLIGGAFVVEVVFGLEGLGLESIRAIQTHDAQVLVGTLFVVAAITTIGLAMSDLAHGLLDPRVRERLAAKTEGLTT